MRCVSDDEPRYYGQDEGERYDDPAEWECELCRDVVPVECGGYWGGALWICETCHAEGRPRVQPMEAAE